MLNKFYVQKFNASDDYFVITDLYINQSEYVKKGELIFSIESSKADIDIDTDKEGYLYYNLAIGQRINVGELFYIISDEKISDWEIEFKNSIEIKSNNLELLISNKAKKIIEENGINPLDLNKKNIKEIDVINYLRSLNNENFETIGKKYLAEFKTNTIPVIIIGGGGGAKMLIDLLKNSTKYQVVGILDDKLEIGYKVMEVNVVGSLNDVKLLLDFGINNFILAFGVLTQRDIRYQLYLNLKALGCIFPNIIHSNAIVEESVIMGEGNVILAMANVGSCVKIGNLNYINNNALISHDCELHDNVHLAPASVLASSIIVESNVLIGMNTTLYYGIKIGKGTTILNGLIINNSISNNVIQKTNN
jgi:sugar O-acyltransferase (sialic acid O-acetyltransferase NeuD family)